MEQVDGDACDPGSPLLLDAVGIEVIPDEVAEGGARENYQEYHSLDPGWSLLPCLLASFRDGIQIIVGHITCNRDYQSTRICCQA